MKTYLLKALWGMENLSMEEQFSKIAEAGYTGIEARMPPREQESRFKSLLKQHELVCIVQIGRDRGAIESFTEHVKRAAEFEPLLINSHSSKHDLAYEEQLLFFEKALKIEREVGLPVAHETHRGRALFTPWTTARLLRQFEDLKITADFSHWCCVCESLLQDQEVNVKLACERAIHIHGRVGNSEGAQVSHPAAPEYAEALQTHMSWWRSIYRNRKARGAEFFTFDPEFGPVPYLPTLPFTGQPVADLWEVNLWMGRTFMEQVRSWEDE